MVSSFLLPVRFGMPPVLVCCQAGTLQGQVGQLQPVCAPHLVQFPEQSLLLGFKCLKCYARLKCYFFLVALTGSLALLLCLLTALPES